MCIEPLRTVIFRTRVVNVVAVYLNYIETTLELYYRADTYVLGREALVISDFIKPINVQGYHPAIVSMTCRTISGAIGYFHPVSGGKLPPCDPPGYSYTHPQSPFVVSHAMSHGGCYY